MERIVCPFCGESISSAAKKCRFCGEWLSEEALPIQQRSQSNEMDLKDESLEVPVAGDLSQSPVVMNEPNPVYRKDQVATVMNNEHPNQGIQQNIVVQPHIVIENTQEVYQEQNVEMNVESGGQESAGGCLWSQLVVVSIGLGIAFHGFWYGVAAFILLSIAVFVPYLGQAVCIISGLAFGLVAGVLSASFGAATWIAWLIGIVSSVSLVYWNLEQRKSEA